MDTSPYSSGAYAFMVLVHSLPGLVSFIDHLVDSAPLSSSSEMALGHWKLLPIHISQVSYITNICTAGSTNTVPVCGPPRYAELRINLSQAFNGIGTVVAPVLGSYVFFLKTQDDVQALKNVQWVYLAIAIFVFVLAVVFYL
jgi:hypothetical protein